MKQTSLQKENCASICDNLSDYRFIDFQRRYACNFACHIDVMFGQLDVQSVLYRKLSWYTCMVLYNFQNVEAT